MIYKHFLFKNKIPLMNVAMDAYASRQRVISKNIANVTSPHYRPEAVKFEEFFHEAAIVATGNRTDMKHIPMGKKRIEDVRPEVHAAHVPGSEIYFSGETHVNIDREMSNLAQNQIRFRFTSRSMKSYFKGMQSSISGR